MPRSFPEPDAKISSLAVLPLLFVSLAVWSGCGKKDEIQRYRVPKQHVLDEMFADKTAAKADSPARAGTSPHGMPSDVPGHPEMSLGGAPSDVPGHTSAAANSLLGAIILRGEQAWFFKVVGPADSLAGQQEAFKSFMQSVRFADAEDATPEWTLPKGWSRQDGTGIRFATLQFGPPQRRLKMSVTPLRRVGTDDDEYLLSNINYWRAQVSQPPIRKDQLSEQTVKLDLDGATAILVSVAGKSAPADATEGSALPAPPDKTPEDDGAGNGK